MLKLVGAALTVVMLGSCAVAAAEAPTPPPTSPLASGAVAARLHLDCPAKNEASARQDIVAEFKHKLVQAHISMQYNVKGPSLVYAHPVRYERYSYATDLSKRGAAGIYQRYLRLPPGRWLIGCFRERGFDPRDHPRSDYAEVRIVKGA
jgi:hypothetical protein